MVMKNIKIQMSDEEWDDGTCDEAEKMCSLWQSQQWLYEKVIAVVVIEKAGNSQALTVEGCWYWHQLTSGNHNNFKKEGQAQDDDNFRQFLRYRPASLNLCWNWHCTRHGLERSLGIILVPLDPLEHVTACHGFTEWRKLSANELIQTF